ncbi:nucleotidyl transferase [Lujinxingia litoralis]|uniref:Nucleotidyl transferase n=1 Tax=Lujinxingia litoralis TaxID=2211119 RepID=A0A328CCD8_9DELT|nr:phosphocholine cytidylyltransferase family protein [Lujinxingia litoralis]RAL24861.1 nucleotidyl transferase [Lujinxingia litoralis]
MRAIIIAAGRGSRLQHHTDERPKCMVRVGERSILDHQLEAYRAHGVDDLHIIRGYLAERLVVPGATYHHNARWPENNILQSLFCAEEAIEGPLLISYSDIVFGPPVVKAALSTEHDITLVIDRQWHRAYQGRHDHPVEQAELARVDQGLVRRVGKHVGPEGALGEFIGLTYLSERGAHQLREAFARVRQRLDLDAIFRNQRTFQKAYLCDLFEELIDQGVSIGAAPIDGGWREIDTVEDLHAVNAGWQSQDTPA